MKDNPTIGVPIEIFVDGKEVFSYSCRDPKKVARNWKAYKPPRTAMRKVARALLEASISKEKPIKGRRRARVRA